MIPFIVSHLVLNESNMVLYFFSSISIASFFLQYPCLFYVLKYSSNFNKRIIKNSPSPQNTFIFCSKGMDESDGGILTRDEYRQAFMGKVVPGDSVWCWRDSKFIKSIIFSKNVSRWYNGKINQFFKSSKSKGANRKLINHL